MRIHIGFALPVLILNICLFAFCVVGCGTFGQAPEFAPKRIEYKKPIDFRLKGRVGYIDRMRVQSKSITETFESGTLRKEEKEIVDFLLETKIVAVQANGNISYETTTLEKDGPTNLRDLAFPEEGETLQTTLDSKSKVIKSGSYPKTSLFYIPPVSFPEGEVNVGDTWEMSHNWMSMRNALNMRVEIVSILKAVYECGVKEKCAEIEISGAIGIIGPMAQSLPLKSEIVGRMLVDLETGTVIWSDIRNYEELVAEETIVKVRSCMETVLSDPVAKRWMWRSVPDCDPTMPIPSTVPGY